MIVTEGPIVDGAIVVGFDGVLDVETAPVVRGALMTCLGRVSELVVADLSNLAAASRAVLAVFPAARRHGPDSATRLVLCAPSDALRRLMTGRILGDLRVYPTCEEAVATARESGPGSSRMTLRLWPTATAPATAREAVVDACHAWAIDDVSDSAALVVSELVTNAVAHARTNIDVTFALRRGYLHIGVRDRAPMPDPVPAEMPDRRDEHGRGLYFVSVFATTWGMSPQHDGKMVWATLRATPSRPREVR